MRPMDEQRLLDILWTEDRKTFLQIWYEGISTREMIATLKRDYPEVHQACMTELYDTED